MDLSSDVTDHDEVRACSERMHGFLGWWFNCNTSFFNRGFEEEHTLSGQLINFQYSRSCRKTPGCWYSFNWGYRNM